MKTKMNAKKLLTTLLMLLMCVLLVVSFTACSKSSTETPKTATSDEAVTEANDEYASIWADATYTKDTVVGKGSKTFYFETKVGTHSVIFTVNTDKATVGEALLDNKLIAGEDGDYGLYVKTVNGILADYDVNATYWGFYQDGEYMMTGVDTTEIESGAHYEMVYEKG